MAVLSFNKKTKLFTTSTTKTQLRRPSFEASVSAANAGATGTLKM